MKKKILEIITENPDGIEADSLESIVLDQLHIDNALCSSLLKRMIADNFIKIIKVNNQYRYQSVISQNFTWPTTFKLIGPPQSQVAIETLNNTLLNYPEELTIVLDITSPIVFGKLEERLRRKLKTIILLPSIKEIEIERKENYMRIIQEWKELYIKYKAYNSLTILISQKYNKSIRTTIYCKDFARINIRDINSSSTRNGILVEVANSNALYKQYFDDISFDLRYSNPLFLINPIKYLKKKILVPIIILILLLISCRLYDSDNNLLAMFASLIIGFLGNTIYAKYKNIQSN